ncbi:aconitate hydratase [Chytridiales sp. JEL 0842]|nr:aconitate hydratase [Chytridiales sp. JEL 0842]
MIRASRFVQRSLATAAAAASPSASNASSQIVPPYAALISKLDTLKKKGVTNRTLTLAEKILYSHISNPVDITSKVVRGETYLKLTPDRVAMQDASAQMAILQFMLAGRSTTAVPSSIHCDHLIQANEGADKDVASAMVSSKEIFEFLESAAKRYGIAFWKPGSGIIHQIVLENYAAPGALMLGTDSHTPNGGGLGMLAIGVGGADAVDGMAGIPWELKAPKVIGMRLTGKLNGWASPKDVILHIAGKLTVQGGTNHIIEYFGPGVDTLSCTGMATICNMGAEVGATTSVFPYSEAMSHYLRATGRSHVADAADKAASQGFLAADKGVDYDKVIDIDLSTIEPHINGPFTPDAATPISKFKNLVEEKGWKDEVTVGLIGSCTNSSYQDMTRAVSIARQASAVGLKSKAQFMVTPGSEQIRATIERDGIMKDFEEAGAMVLANACIGQWKRKDGKTEEDNAILSSFNRNFRGRNDGSVKTMNFLASPEIVTAMAISGKLTFDPTRDSILLPNGESFKFDPPSDEALPPRGFDAGREGYKPAATQTPAPETKITVDPKSQRLQILQSFDAWDGQEIKDMRVLIKVQGKCTTDHISAAGVWLKYKGHLENISMNTLIGAVNAYTGKVNCVTNELSNKEDTVPNVALAYQKEGVNWTVIGDWNYGEGSAQTNLKKQGIIPLTFVNPDDYNLITPGCTISTIGLSELAPGSKVFFEIKSASGETHKIPMAHTLSGDQLGWIKAGSALNLIAQSK